MVIMAMVVVAAAAAKRRKKKRCRLTFRGPILLRSFSTRPLRRCERKDERILALEIRASTLSYATLKLAKNSFTAGAVTGRRARFELLSQKWKWVKGTTGSDVTYEYAFNYNLRPIRRIKFFLSRKKCKITFKYLSI